MNTRISIYLSDLRNKGLSYFILSRLKKRPITRKMLAITFKPYVLIQGNKLFIDKMDNVVSETLLSTGTWEPYYTKLFVRYATKAQTVVDIGAHIGYYSLLASLNIKKGGRVIAFEPCQRTTLFLKKTISENNLKNIILVNKAIDKSTGKAKLFLNTANIGAHRLNPLSESNKFQKTNTVTLDDYFSKDNSIIDLMKIDIEGNEVNALTGMKKLLSQKRIKIIMTELWPKGLLAAGSSWEKYVILLHKAGFTLWEPDINNKKLIPFSASQIKKQFTKNNEFITNLICIQNKFISPAR